MTKFIKSEYPELEGAKFIDSNHPDVVARLMEIESQMIVDRYKFGVLYVRDGQTEENDIFSNNTTSREFEDFLNFLGERITLEGWDKFRGGLDCKKNTTGTQSVYTKFRDFQIM